MRSECFFFLLLSFFFWLALEVTSRSVCFSLGLGNWEWNFTRCLLSALLVSESLFCCPHAHTCPPVPESLFFCPVKLIFQEIKQQQHTILFPFTCENSFLEVGHRQLITQLICLQALGGTECQEIFDSCVLFWKFWLLNLLSRHK